MTDPAKIAAGLTALDKSIANALLGNSWTGFGDKSPGLRRMIDLGLMQVVNLGARYKVSATDVGLAVRAILKEQDAGASHED